MMSALDWLMAVLLIVFWTNFSFSNVGTFLGKDEKCFTSRSKKYHGKIDQKTMKCVIFSFDIFVKYLKLIWKRNKK